MRPHVLAVLFKKDLKSCIGNKSILITLLLPVFFAVLYNYLFADMTGIPGDYVLLLCTVMVISIVPISVLSTMIAEEKEKNTLRSLMLANVTGMEFVLSKALVCLLILLFEGGLLFAVCGAGGKGAFAYFLILFLASFAIICFGAVIGIASKDQMSAGTLGSPLMMVMMLPPIFGQFNETIEKIARFFPTSSLYQVYPSAVKGESLISGDNLFALAVCALWVIAGIVCFQVIYKKKGLDE